MKAKVFELAYKGEWDDLLALLRAQPDLVNSESELKGYTPLHQAAWHGASLSVVGELLALGANPLLRTKNKNQSAREIAAEKHPGRNDLQFLLIERGRTMAQLMRKIAAENPQLFVLYDGNQILFDRLIDCFGADACCRTSPDFDGRLSAAFSAITGESLTSARPFPCGDIEDADPGFWVNRFAILLRGLASRAHCIPIEKHWVVVSDLFDPDAEGWDWGLRGDKYLWMEMRQSLCHVPLPDEPEAIKRTITSAFLALTGEALNPRAEFFVPRFSRGGMTSGKVTCDFWAEKFIPQIQQRAHWIKESWCK